MRRRIIERAGFVTYGSPPRYQDSTRGVIVYLECGHRKEYTTSRRAPRQWCDCPECDREIVVAHCGHPTALWPWAVYVAGQIVAAPNGRAFQFKKEAEAAAELLRAGRLQVHDRGGSCPLVLRHTDRTVLSEPGRNWMRESWDLIVRQATG